MYSAIIFCVLGLASGQLMLHGHNLREMVDRGFEHLDHQPKDGTVTLAEFADINFKNDLDHNQCVTLQEFKSTHPYMSDEVATKLFDKFDITDNNCVAMDDMIADFNLMDHNNNGQITLHEFEQYMTHMLNKLFGH